MHKVVILDNIRSSHNVGSIFRTSDGAGVELIYLLGYTPTPIDRFGRVEPKIAKTSLSATLSVPWEQVEPRDELALITRLKSDGYTVVAVEQTKQAVDFYEFDVPDKVAYIFGAEVEGVRPELLAAVDKIIELPMRGKKESLNVSVTAGIVLFTK